VGELNRPHHYCHFSTALANTFHDFSRRLCMASGLLAGHRFWRLVESIDDRLQTEIDATASVRWWLELSFGGWEHDLIEVRLFRGRRSRTDSASEWDGPFAELLRLDETRLPRTLALGLSEGTLILSEAPRALWVVEDIGHDFDSAVVVLARTGSTARSGLLQTRWHEVGGDWARSDRLSGDAVADLVRRLGVAGVRPEPLAGLAFEGGVPTRRGSWLGRPEFLPKVRTSAASIVSVRPLQITSDILEVGPGTLLRPLQALGPLSGRWTVAAQEADSEDDRVLVLESEIPERREWPADTAVWEAETELVLTGTHPFLAFPCAWSDEPEIRSFDDVAEALYASVGSGRGEAELVKLLEPVLPEAWLVWDVLRALAEGGWLELRVCRAWRARRWRLCPPTLVSGEIVVVEGAVGAAARRRLSETVARRGGCLRSTTGRGWAPPVIAVTGVEPQVLAADLDWPLVPSTRPHLQVAPACWPSEKRSTDGRDLVGIWDFELGLFQPPDGVHSGLRLERWVHERDRDLYQLVRPTGSFLTSSRTVAVLEAHRCARRPMFSWKDGAFRRIGRSGHLPLPVARALRRRTLTPSGPITDEYDVWTYRYAVDAASAAWVGAVFGAAVKVPNSVQSESWLQRLVARRRAGLSPAWLPARSDRPGL
jgi:hypothetical protein